MMRTRSLEKESTNAYNFKSAMIIDMGGLKQRRILLHSKICPVIIKILHFIAFIRLHTVKLLGARCLFNTTLPWRTDMLHHGLQPAGAPVNKGPVCLSRHRQHRWLSPMADRRGASESLTEGRRVGGDSWAAAGGA